VRERQSIDQFRSTAHVFSNPGEQKAQINDIVALMVLRCRIAMLLSLGTATRCNKGNEKSSKIRGV
jgi:hypothetical protein